MRSRIMISCSIIFFLFSFLLFYSLFSFHFFVFSVNAGRKQLCARVYLFGGWNGIKFLVSFSLILFQQIFYHRVSFISLFFLLVHCPYTLHALPLLLYCQYNKLLKILCLKNEKTFCTSALDSKEMVFKYNSCSHAYMKRWERWRWRWWSDRFLSKSLCVEGESVKYLDHLHFFQYSIILCTCKNQPITLMDFKFDTLLGETLNFYGFP